MLRFTSPKFAARIFGYGAMEVVVYVGEGSDNICIELLDINNPKQPVQLNLVRMEVPPPGRMVNKNIERITLLKSNESQFFLKIHYRNYEGHAFIFGSIIDNAIQVSHVDNHDLVIDYRILPTHELLVFAENTVNYIISPAQPILYDLSQYPFKSTSLAVETEETGVVFEDLRASDYNGSRFSFAKGKHDIILAKCAQDRGFNDRECIYKLPDLNNPEAKPRELKRPYAKVVQDTTSLSPPLTDIVVSYIENNEDRRLKLTHEHSLFEPEVKVQPLSAEAYKQKEMVEAALDAYIKRIEEISNTSRRFAEGFWFFSASRAVNRKINYLLAKKLKDQISSSTASLETIFKNINQQRLDVIYEHNLHLHPDYVDRGINSSELNSIVNSVNRKR